MSQVITINIPHQLSRAEVKRRIQEEVARAQPRLGPLAGAVKQTWTGDTLDFSVSVGVQKVCGQAFIEDRQVRVTIELPWILAALTGAVRQGIEQRGRQLLGYCTQSSARS
jgi:hypothetical protein